MAKNSNKQQENPQEENLEIQEIMQPKANPEPQVRFTGTFNEDSMSFEVSEGMEGTLAVQVNEKPWGKSTLQAPLTVVRGTQLPSTYRISYQVQPI